MHKPNKIIEKAKKIKMLILDVDGVLTDGRLLISDEGKEYKAFHTQDGLGIKRLQKLSHINIAIISGRKSKAVEYRLNDLEVENVYLGHTDKQPAFEELLTTYSLQPQEVAYAGDDLPDLKIMKQIGLSIAVDNAVDEVKRQADMITTRQGGAGAVREICDFLIETQK